jgi:Mce-associated membrane protein
MAVDADSTVRALSPSQCASRESVIQDSAVEDDDDDEVTADDSTETGERTDPVATSLRLAALVGVLVVVALAGLAIFLGVRAYQAHQLNDQRNLLLETGRQTALNLTTIDWQHADADVQRILASATGEFFDDFAQRSKPFVDVVKQTQSTSVGTVTESGLESLTGNEAQVLVTVAVKTTDSAASQPDPRNWRMRMTVEKVGNGAKVSDVQFVQ